MAPPLLLSIHDAVVTFGGKPLFDGLSVNLHAGEKICLVGKNGAGKTTLMKLITGERELDGGERWQEIGLTIGYLRQEVEPEEGQSVREYVATGLEEDKQNEAFEYLVDKVLEPFGLHKDQQMTKLSGGQVRRAALARSLIEDPDILLLDEPTNHLDLGAIEWLETYLRGYRGTVLCISHDRTFLANMSNKVFWLDRSRVRVCPKGFAHFEEWSQQLLEQEERELRKREKLVAQEIEWSHKGISARRKRNVRRVGLMREMRDKLKADKSAYRQATKTMDLPPIEPAQSARIISEFYRVKKKYVSDERETVILDGFSMRMMRGDRIGILGRNGSGKTTFLKMLLGEEEPDSGNIKRNKHLEISYFDQRRQMLDPDETIRRTLCPGGGEYVNVGGKMRHVCGYLKDFMFDPKAVDDKVATLSGGQRNRLMLAYVLANPGNLLILDEPTNDLDMDTLDILEEILCNYTGTLICVSHDRDFLDQTVSRLMAFEGNGKIEQVVGGYEDYLRAVGRAPEKKVAKGKVKPTSATPPKQDITKAPEQKKLSYKVQYELDGLPKRMEQLEVKKAELEALMADSTLYSRDPDAFDKATRSFALIRSELEEAEARWLELEELRLELDAS